MARRFLVVALVSSFALIAPILLVNVSVESGQRSPAIDELQSKVLIAYHVRVCLHKDYRRYCSVWKRVPHERG